MIYPSFSTYVTDVFQDFYRAVAALLSVLRDANCLVRRPVSLASEKNIYASLMKLLATTQTSIDILDNGATGKGMSNEIARPSMNEIRLRIFGRRILGIVICLIFVFMI